LRSPALRKPAPPPGLDHLKGGDGRVLVDLDLLRAMPATRRRTVFARGGAVDKLRRLLTASAPAA
jgi:hypothetical protein